MSFAADQAERFRATPCPAVASRRKLKSLGLSNHKVEILLNQYPKKLAAAEKALSKPVDNRDAFTVFTDLLTSVGGHYQAYRPEMTKKEHTDGKHRRDSASFVLEMDESDAEKILKLVNGGREADMRKEFGKYYIRDSRGCMRRIFAK